MSVTGAFLGVASPPNPTWMARIVINEALLCVRRRRPTVEFSLVAENATASAQKEMRFKPAAAGLALAFAFGGTAAYGANPNDAEIAHIA